MIMFQRATTGLAVVCVAVLTAGAVTCLAAVPETPNAARSRSAAALAEGPTPSLADLLIEARRADTHESAVAVHKGIKRYLRDTGAYSEVMTSGASMLSSADPDARLLGISLISQARGPYRRSAVEAERRESLELRAQALGLLAEMLPQEDDIKVRRAIAIGASRTALPGSVPVLIAMADDPEPSVARRAVERLGGVGSANPALTPAILPFLVDRLAAELSASDVLSRRDAHVVVRALSHLNDRRALDAIETAARHESFGYQLVAIKAIRAMAGRNRRGPRGRPFPVGLRQYAINQEDRDRAEGLLREAITQAHEAYAHIAQEALDSLAREDEKAAERERRRLETRARNAAPPE